MTRVSLSEIRKSIRENNPLIHCITNPVSINQCANTILSTGARPIMAEHPDEAEEITVTAGALMLNIANITDARMRSIKLSAACADKNGIPFLLDAVGVSCSSMRRSYALSLISEHCPTVIKGNYSEICALEDPEYRSSGVDAHASADAQRTIESARSVALKYKTVVLASGKTDLITDGKRLISVRNGTPRLGSITGTGCMQGALTSAYLSCAGGMEAASLAAAVLGICGELAASEKGMGSFSVSLFDWLSAADDNMLAQRIRLEEKALE